MKEIKLDESIIPMNFNFRQAKQTMAEPVDNNINHHLLNPDAVIQHEPDQKLELERKYRMYARQLLNHIYNIANNIVKGHTTSSFNEDKAYLLEISLENKIVEILNGYSQQIHNDYILEELRNTQNITRSEYYTNIQRYGLNNLGKIAYNINGVIIINPYFLYDIVQKWVYEHTSHTLETDQFICE